MKWLALIFALFYSLSSHSAVSYKPLSYKKKNLFIVDGVFLGGKEGKTLDLVAVRRRFYSKSHIDRWIFDLGEKQKTYKDAPPLVHIALNRLRRTLTIDIKKVKMKAGGEIVGTIKRSEFVKDVQVIQDEFNSELTLHILLKKPVALEAFFLPNNKKQARLVLDLSAKLSE